jgi:hypothetical protein
VWGSCEHGDEPSSPDATELVRYLVTYFKLIVRDIQHLLSETKSQQGGYIGYLMVCNNSGYLPLNSVRNY